MAKLTVILALTPALAAPLFAAGLPGQWQRYQSVRVASPGLVRLDLSGPALDAAHHTLRDLRLQDPDGREVSFYVNRRESVPARMRRCTEFSTELRPAETLVRIRVGAGAPVDALFLKTPAKRFLKSVSVDGLVEGEWRPAAAGRPIFRQDAGAENLRIDLPAERYSRLRVRLDDARSKPIPITGARLRARSPRPRAEPEALRIEETFEDPDRSRLIALLPARNLHVLELKLEIDDPAFFRSVEALSRRYVQGKLREVPIGKGTVYRIPGTGEARLTIPVLKRVRGRRIVLRVRNGDSPPLRVRSVEARVVPASVVFFARRAGDHFLLVGNREARPPRHDLPGLREKLSRAQAARADAGPVRDNPAHSPSEALPMADQLAAPINVSNWKRSARVEIERAGIQRLELTPRILSRAMPDLRDVRLVRGNLQVPYILDREGALRTLSPEVRKAAADPGLSRWALRFPHENLPITHLSCRTRKPLFDRNVKVYEMAPDSRGRRSRRYLGSAHWVRRPGARPGTLRVTLTARPRTDTLLLEIADGDNPPLELEDFTAHYAAPRVLFKSDAREETRIFYGNPRASTPRYDIALAAREFLDADALEARASEESSDPRPWAFADKQSAWARALFWAVLALVTLALLAVIRKLVPVK